MNTHEPPRIETHRLAASAGFPNNPMLPLLVYCQAIPRERPDTAREVERRLESNGWSGAWRNGVYSFHHFHSNAHELLAVCAGHAEIQFGGPSGPIVAVAAGDVAILPAGTGHKRVRATSDFVVVGAYPGGQDDYDLCRGEPEEQSAAAERIARVPLPEADPLFGPDGRCLSIGLEIPGNRNALECHGNQRSHHRIARAHAACRPLGGSGRQADAAVRYPCGRPEGLRQP